VIDTHKLNVTAMIPESKTLLVDRRVTEEAEFESKTPILGDLPLVGGLFRNYSRIRDQKTVLILIETTVNPEMQPPPPLDPDDPLAKKLREKFEGDKKAPEGD